MVFNHRRAQHEVRIPGHPLSEQLCSAVTTTERQADRIQRQYNRNAEADFLVGLPYYIAYARASRGRSADGLTQRLEKSAETHRWPARPREALAIKRCNTAGPPGIQLPHYRVLSVESDLACRSVLVTAGT